MRPLRPLAPLAALVLLAGCGSSPPSSRSAASGRLPLEPCATEGLPEDALCGTHEVWEDREARSGRKIPIHVVVLPALGPEPAPDPLFFFAGGPGEGVSDGAGFTGEVLAPIRERRDLVFVDQRGTGGSYRLQCRLSGGDDDLQGYFEDFLTPEVVEACRRELETRADLALYTTSIAMDDVDEVRRRLGYERINLDGGSYGTRAVQVYLRRHPESVRSVVLGGVTAMHQHLPLFHARDGARALDLLLEACAADEACGTAFPGLEREHREVLERLERKPARTVVPHPETGEPVEITVRREVFVEHLRLTNYTAGRAAALPFLVHRAHDGDFGPFALVTLAVEPPLREALAFGLFLSVTCAEDLPFISAEETAAAVAGTYLGDYRVAMQRRACERWVRGVIPEGFHEPVRSEVPALLVSGPYDPVTPPRWAEEVAAHLPASRHVVIPEGHHGPFGLSNLDCVLHLEAEFLERGSAEGLDTSCVETMERKAFLTTAEEFEAWMGEGEE